MNIWEEYKVGIILGAFWLYMSYLFFRLWKHDMDNVFIFHDDDDDLDKKD